MMILSRHILREHVAPFLYALFVITALFLVDFVVQMMDSILSKGLDWRVVLELFLLNTAWMLALSVPMSVLVGTLMAFGRMSADREIDAMRAAGMHPARMILPPLLVACLLAWGLVQFNNRVLPEANFRAASLREDITRKRPTVLLEPRTMVQDFEGFRVWIQNIDPATDSLRDILIHQLDRAGGAPTVISARRGVVSLDHDGRMWKFTLHDGQTHSPDRSDPRKYVRIRFQELAVDVPNVDDRLHRSDKTYRSDREMPIEAMRERVRSARERESTLVAEQGERIFADLRFVTSLLELDSMAATGVKPDTSSQASSVATRSDEPPPGKRRKGKPAPPAPAFAAPLRAMADGALAGLGAPVVPPGSDDAPSAVIASRMRQVKVALEQVRSERGEADRFLVEIHKKFSIPVACIVFVLVGAPLGVMARAGGVGTGVAYSLSFFVLYWVCLIGGESLADRGIVQPAVAMWTPNAVLGLLGVWLVSRMGREVQFFRYRWVLSALRLLRLLRPEAV